MCRLDFPIIPMLSILLLFSQKLVAQVDSSIPVDSSIHKVFSGKVIDDSLGYAVPSVHIWNESTRMGSVSNDSGEFSIRVRGQDTLIFSSIGYVSNVILALPSYNQHVAVRLKPQKYEIGELIVRRFRSYESFLYQVVHHDLPETKTDELKEYIKLTSTVAALEADIERAAKDKLETGRFGYTTVLGRGISLERAFKERMSKQKKREQVIRTKYNRAMVGEITQLEGDELTEFIALCNFSEDYLYEADLYTIIEAINAKYSDYLNMADSVQSVND